MLTYSTATPQDAENISRLLRDADQREVRTMTSQEPPDVLPLVLRHSKQSFAVFRNRDKNPTILYGVSASPLGKDYGMVWLCATNDMHKCRVEFFKAVPEILAELSQGFKYLHCLADSRNTLHNRWLELIGFVRTSSHDVKGVLFHHYTLIR